MRALVLAGLMAGAALLVGCAGIEPPKAPELTPPSPLPLVQQAPRRGSSGGVFVADNGWSLTSDVRSFHAGDVLTVLLDETTQASKKANTSFGKNSDVSISPATLAGKALKTDIGLSSQNNFAGNAASTQQNALQGAITVIVHEVMPNGLLRVQGEKSLYLNQGEEMIRLSGYVRAADITPDNRVSSQRLAEARIAYAGSGALADTNNAGWLSRFFASPWMPF
ncbi:flagellar basal body L-ring protein FlgH [Ideonella azotifigens]|uniref:Flagellar L-ring protein n=1 Tax=Ideonella azotifigens TaxID=513160 RepID=A0ABN1K9D0_9BURK|nr:flagellar basal body L-ring protein FlgH [Ideonella azotifigens]MCD2339093.1 flagellar basal body L-ring protein FlgH [Ideonella azotifigens]